MAKVKETDDEVEHEFIPEWYDCPFCGSICTECLVCPECDETKGLECCMPAGVGCPCIACEERQYDEWEPEEE